MDKITDKRSEKKNKMQQPRILRAPEGVVSLFDQSLITVTLAIQINSNI